MSFRSKYPVWNQASDTNDLKCTVDIVYDNASGVFRPVGTKDAYISSYNLRQLSTSFIRPTGTGQYSVGDAISNYVTSGTAFQLDMSQIGATSGQPIEIRKLIVNTNVKKDTLPLYNVYLSPVIFSGVGDRAPLNIANSIMESGGAWLNLDSQNFTTGNCQVSLSNANQQVLLHPADTKLYGAVQAANAYIPSGSEKITVIAYCALL